MIWAIFAFMVLVALAILVLPLLRAKPAAMARGEYDLAVYKDQLGELERDLERGVLTADQGEAARVEIQRRILAAADGGKESATRSRPMIAVAAIAVAVPLAAFGLYGLLGQPALPDQPYAARAPQMQDMQDQAKLFRDMVANLAAKLEKNPEDGKGWAMMGRSLRVLGEPEQSRDAYEKALKLLPKDATVRLEYGALLLDEVPQGSPLPPTFVTLMREVNSIDPDQPDALYFLGIAAMQAGSKAEARKVWTKLLDQVPPDSDDRVEILKMIESTN